MRIHFIGLCFVLLPALSSGAPQGETRQDEPAEQAPEVEELSTRIITLRERGLVVIDRGQADGVQRGDRVFFTLLSGGSFQGRVIGVEERRAGVQLVDRGAKLPVGTRGELRIPVSRFAEEQAPAVEDAAPPVVAGEGQDWERDDSGWTPELPLLAKVEAIRPEKRPMSISGRAYLSGDHAWTSTRGRSDFFYRAGTNLLVENPFERGGAVNFDAELNYRGTDLPDDEPDELASRLRIDRASYSWGGTRFNKKRQEVGRFLQDGMPEFGIIDGYEYGRRLESGNRFGGSVGFMPEPTPQMKSGSDFQVSGFYEWVSDKREELTATAGYQKTLHNGSVDRDLVIGKLRYLPLGGWDFNGSLWLDLYTSGDVNKNAPVGLTYALLSSGRRWDDGSSLTFTFAHQSFPDIKRFEFTPPVASQIADARVDRLSASGWTMLDNGNRWHNRMGAWVDQDDVGGDLETGLEMWDLFWEGSRSDLTVFGTQGAYSVVYGARGELGGSIARSSWNLSYEFSSHDLAGFASDNNTIYQHRVSGDLNLFAMRDWAFTLNGTGVIWNSESSLRMGFYLQRRF